MKNQPNKDKDLAVPGVESALLRAAKKARQVAKQTNTPLVIMENGKVVEKRPSDID